MPDTQTSEGTQATQPQPVVDSSQQVTSKHQTSVKKPKRLAACKAIAAKTNQAREERKKTLTESRVITANNKAKETLKASLEKEVSPDTDTVVIADTNIAVNLDKRNVLATTQWLTVVSIFVSMVGIYYKREEIKRVFTKRPQQTPPPSPVDAARPQSRVKEKASALWIEKKIIELSPH